MSVTTSLLRTAVILPVVAALTACQGGAGAGAQDAAQSDVQYAIGLLERAALTVDSAAIRRVIRDDLETVVWIEPRIRGLPVFLRQVGYVFDADGNRSADPFSGTPLVLGDALPYESMDVDRRPAVTADRAIAAYRQQVRDAPEPVDAEEPLEAVLGYIEGPPGQYVLVWRVRPLGREYPVVMVDAKSGGIASQDSGIRCVTAPCP